MAALVPAPAFLPALPPLAFLPMHLTNLYFIGNVLPYKAVTLPRVLAVLYVLQYLFEHLSHHQSVDAIGALYTPITALIFASLIAFYVICFIKGQTKYVAGSLVGFIVQVVVFTQLQGPPPDSVEAAVRCAKDDDYLRCVVLGGGGACDMTSRLTSSTDVIDF